MDLTWLRPTIEDVRTEQLQAQQEGRDLDGLEGEFDALLDPARFLPERFNDLMDEVQARRLRDGYEFVEPSDLDAIFRERPSTSIGRLETASDLDDRMRGAWLGRCCGCVLGKPTEGWRRPKMRSYLEATGQWPLAGYIVRDQEALDAVGYGRYRNFAGEFDGMPEDDDINYTVTGLKIVSQYGHEFTPNDVAQFWAWNLPILHTCTAERVAYRNLCNGLMPPDSATFRNPYREWIGAQIRADFWGYAHPGDPESAAKAAWKDASVSHVKNGIYGEMWAAAMIAAAFGERSIREIVMAGLDYIPARSRLADAVRNVVQGFDVGRTAEATAEDIHTRWNEGRAHDWCHTISNAEIVTTALLYGDGDFAKTVCWAVSCCFDTDCNGATAGSVLGARYGASVVPESFSAPIGNTVHTGIHGLETVSLDALVEESLRLAVKR